VTKRGAFVPGVDSESAGRFYTMQPLSNTHTLRFSLVRDEIKPSDAWVSCGSRNIYRHHSELKLMKGVSYGEK
jgi:hypothetical protein